jgi:hypothetical protein
MNRLLSAAEHHAIECCKRAICERRAAKLDNTGKYQWADLDREIQDIQARITRIENGNDRVCRRNDPSDSIRPTGLGKHSETTYRTFFRTEER